MRFCSDCGALLAGAATPVDSSGERAPQGAASEPAARERRLVSVLFADLVGFTTLSEARDPEEVRELLSRYFDECRRVIERYGGTVQKFIGDAVMAVWGAPVAREDDAERSVRAALELVRTVADLGLEVGVEGLAARAGVLTGEAAVMPGGSSEGLVVGDLVNTASRLQTIAPSGGVVVGDSTKRASEAAIAYEEGGVHELKGKAEPVRAWRALRVVAGAGGSLRSSSLEAPFVGRDRELRLVKELYHASEEERRAQLLTIAGIAGIGKSRLAWEFEKYVDGLVGDVWWHRGRCLSYGDGIAYWALAEMVRMRCGIIEDEAPAPAREKLRATVAEHVTDAHEREWVEPRLAHLLGLEEGVPGDQENLFSAWRILFERLAEKGPTVLVLEDVQWADEGLLDFLEYLVEWSHNHPIFVLALVRPEFAERRPGWGAGKRSYASLHLEPLSPSAMTELLSGLVPGLPDDLRSRILAQAAGVPLYAVETVRMLLDQGLLARAGDVTVPTGPIETLQVPETLHALIAARLDNLAPVERRLVQDGSVLGKTFTKQGLAFVSELSEVEVEAVLGSLVRKELLSIQADPRSPERGQYAFLQDVVKQVAYESIGRQDRKAKHLAAAEFLASLTPGGEDELADVLASHLLDAYNAAPHDEDAAEIRARAGAMLVRAAERSASLAGNIEAQHAYERAIELTDDPGVCAELHERAGVAAHAATRDEEASGHWERAIELLQQGGDARWAARVSARLAELVWGRGQLEDALEGIERSLEVLSEEEPDESVAALAAQAGRFLFFAGRTELALTRIEYALELAEALDLPEVLAEALNTRATIISSAGRSHESQLLLRDAIEIALEHDKPSPALRAYYNLADELDTRDRYEDALAVTREALAYARRVGHRYWERALLGLGYPLYALGEWDELLANQARLQDEGGFASNRLDLACLLNSAVPAAAHRGLLERAARMVELGDELGASADVQERSYYGSARAALLLASGEASASLASAEVAWEARDALGISHEAINEAFVIGMQAALQAGDAGRSEALLAFVEGQPSGRRGPFLSAQAIRFRALLASRAGDDAEAERLFKLSVGLLRELVVPFRLAVVLLEHAEWLGSGQRGDEAAPLVDEALGVFERLGATPWIARSRRLGSGAAVGSAL
jgi:class 3 adenylate cyclase/tetratricopeptide (TPR) repeat protein